VLFCAAIAIFVWWTHRDNLRKLARGQENRFGRERKASGSPMEEGERAE